jgi:hypothetical protein
VPHLQLFAVALDQAGGPGRVGHRGGVGCIPAGFPNPGAGPP